MTRGRQAAETRPALWSGKDKARLLNLLDAQIQQRGLEVRHSRWPVMKVSRNVRVRRAGPAETHQP